LASRISDVMVNPSKLIGPPDSGVYVHVAPNVDALLYVITCDAMYAGWGLT